MPESAKIVAVKEAIKQVAKPVQDFIEKISGPPAHELAEWMADGIRGYRFNTQLKIYDSAMHKLKSANLNPHSVNLKILVPLLENGSLEEEETMVDMWASLLANAANGSNGNISVSFPAILKEINSKEAEIMSVVFGVAKEKPEQKNNLYIVGVKGDELRKFVGISEHKFEQYIDNLFRLRLLAPPSTTLDFIENSADIPFMRYTKETVCLTYLGYDFMLACTSPTETQSSPE